jgi:predicted amidohydrolase
MNDALGTQRRLASIVSALIGCGLVTAAASSPGRPPQGRASNEFLGDLPAVRRVDHLGRDGTVRPYATYAQCQIEVSIGTDQRTALPVVPDENAGKIADCLAAAVSEGANVLILPELSLAFRESKRKEVLETIRRAAREHQMIVLAGSYYDSNRASRLPVIGPDWEELGYKIHPSRFESSPRQGRGMSPGKELLLVATSAGRIMPLTCVDLISDGVQYTIRNLATRGQVDVIANVNFNPAAWEFMIEANSLARRHPVFVSITNVASAGDAKLQEDCQRTGDTGYCYGNSSLFANLRERDSDCPNCARSIVDLLGPPFTAGPARALPYDSLVAVVPPFQGAVLVYDLNLRLTREPATTNAPDQGYPTVRNVRRVPLTMSN